MNQVGRYQILEELGRGACGVVYRALDPAIGRTVAIKSIRFNEFPDLAERRQMRERVLREAQSAGKLSHPNIVTIYDVLESDDLAYIFMEYVDGPSLRDAMRRDATPTRDQVLNFLRQIAEALDYAHRKGIIHRDIKPANIMISDKGVDRDGFAKIADFGVAKLISHETTQHRALMGTPSYMSPEQLEGVAVGGQSDQFALGVVVYELLTGEKPFVAENLAALHYLICKRTAKPVSEANHKLSETVNKVMERAMAKLPEERYASCSEFIGALSFALGECPEWEPVIPPKMEEVGKHEGNGWYAPETVVSARLLEATSTEVTPSEATVPLADHGPEPKALDPIVLPPLDDFASDPSTSETENESYQGTGSSRGTRIRVDTESHSGPSLAMTMVVCALLAVLGILILRFVLRPGASSQNVESKRVVGAAGPEDLSAASRETSSPPADLTAPPAPPVAKPIPAKSSASSTPVAAQRPAARIPATPSITVPTPTSRAAIAPPVLIKRDPAETISEIELTTDPPGAEVIVDGRSDLTCLSPCSMPLPAGRHTLVAELSGYQVTRKIFNAPSAGSVFVSLNRSTGILVITSQPSGSTVIVDGRDLGPTPLKVKLAAGKHHLVLTDGRRQHEETISIDTDGMYARSFRW